MSKMIKRALLVVPTVLFALLGFVGSADAGVKSGCTVTKIFFDSNRFALTCSTGEVYWTNPGGTCHTATVDQNKIWQSMGQTALLSGKKMNISFELGGTCTLNTIWSLEMY